jgi:hypothetical protein|tara:strand:+ start:158 stop:304 length:147 start_codon:yes stop_codon:yes gene_type:complete
MAMHNIMLEMAGDGHIDALLRRKWVVLFEEAMKYIISMEISAITAQVI